MFENECFLPLFGSRYTQTFFNLVSLWNCVLQHQIRVSTTKRDLGQILDVWITSKIEFLKRDSSPRRQTRVDKKLQFQDFVFATIRCWVIFRRQTWFSCVFFIVACYNTFERSRKQDQASHVVASEKKEIRTSPIQIFIYFLWQTHLIIFYLYLNLTIFYLRRMLTSVLRACSSIKYILFFMESAICFFFF